MLTCRIELLEEELINAYDPVDHLNKITYERAKIFFEKEICSIGKWHIFSTAEERLTIEWGYGLFIRGYSEFVQLVKPMSYKYGQFLGENRVLIDPKIFEMFEKKFRLDAMKTREIVRDYVLEKGLFITKTCI